MARRAFIWRMKKLNLKAHIGAEITSLLPSYAKDSSGAKALCSDAFFTGLKPGASTCSSPGIYTGASTFACIPTPATPRVPLLCASREGYQNLCRLVTRMKLRAPKYPAALPRRAKAAVG